LAYAEEREDQNSGGHPAIHRFACRVHNPGTHVPCRPWNSEFAKIAESEWRISEEIEHVIIQMT
jgi:hypothetical protein